MRVKRALVSVYDKTGIVALAHGLIALGVEIISTGGTARLLRENGLAVKDVAELTGFPEMLDGRVKTLHPHVHGGLLGRRQEPRHRAEMSQHGIAPIDLVAVNLYPFEATAARADLTPDELIEQIDIGGPAMVRSAAKNFAEVIVLTAPEDYEAVLAELRARGDVSLATRLGLAHRAFAITARYDGVIAMNLERLAAADGGLKLNPEWGFTSRLFLALEKAADLRYGENPHQRAALYRHAGRAPAGLAAADQLQGKELSYNNLVDLQAAWDAVSEFSGPTCVIIKHTNPCGAAEPAGGGLAEAYRRAYECDPVSAFGSVIGFNRALDGDTAEAVSSLFVEAIIAPGYDAAARERLAKKKNLRLMQMPAGPSALEWELKRISGGVLVQETDTRRVGRGEWRVVTERAPSAAEADALDFAWRVAKHVKSNAIVYARAGQVVGVGAGQMSRVDSVKIGAMKAVLPLQGTVLASDAFFPFPDGVEEAAKVGVTALIQPGGSVRDAEVIAAANRLGLAMVFTGVRHFKH